MHIGRAPNNYRQKYRTSTVCSHVFFDEDPDSTGHGTTRMRVI